MTDKNLLERLGIIQKVDNEDENGDAATIVATAKAEVAKEVAPSLSKITFVDESPAPPVSSDAPKTKSSSKTAVKPIEPEPEPAATIVEEAPPAIEPEAAMVEEPVAPVIEEEKLEANPKSDKDKFLDEIIDEQPTYNEIIEEEPMTQYEPEPVYEYADEEEAYEEDTYSSYLDVDRYSTINELYETYGKKSGGTDTIFIIDDFAKSLPDNLTKNIKRQSVLNILEASKINLDDLVNDGMERIDFINNYLSTFTERTNEIVSSNEAQVAELEDQIKKLKRLIKERTRLQEKQENVAELETHKIRTALDFIAYTDNVSD